MAPLGPAQRRVLFRDIARYLQKSQGQRIAAQQNPDGSAFEERKPRQKKNGIRQLSGRGRKGRPARKIRQA